MSSGRGAGVVCAGWPIRIGKVAAAEFRVAIRALTRLVERYRLRVNSIIFVHETGFFSSRV